MAGRSVDKKAVRTKRVTAPAPAANILADDEIDARIDDEIDAKIDDEESAANAAGTGAKEAAVHDTEAPERMEQDVMAREVDGQEAGVPQPAADRPVDVVVQDAAAQLPFMGYIDGLDAQWHVVGWVRWLAAVDVRLRVELVENGVTIASDTALRFRGDLVDAKQGDGHSGFQLTIPEGLFDGLRHALAVRVMLPQGGGAVLGQLDIVLPSRLPKAGRARSTAAPASTAKLVEAVLGGGAAQPAHYLDDYVRHLTKAIEAVARDYDFATALGLLYVHILRRHIDEGGLQTRLTRLSLKPEELGAVVREIVHSDEAQGRIKKASGYHLPELQAVQAWTRLRPVS